MAFTFEIQVHNDHSIMPHEDIQVIQEVFQSQSDAVANESNIDASLAICNRIVRKLNGKMRINRTGKFGTKITVAIATKCQLINDQSSSDSLKDSKEWEYISSLS